jgi:hypothetical protein
MHKKFNMIMLLLLTFQLSNKIQNMAQTSQSPFNERDAGLLMVFADPGKEATEAEFHGK